MFTEPNSPSLVVAKRIFLISNAWPTKPITRRAIATKPKIHSIIEFAIYLICSFKFGKNGLKNNSLN
jgi:hypothetical protein